MKGVSLIGVLVSLVTLTAAPARAQARGRASVEELRSQVEEVARQVETARNNIEVVEKQYTLREEPSEAAAQLQRFSDGEIQYLLADYNTAAVLFYDLVANPEFQKSQRYADALFYLADSLYQQKNYLGARLYLRQLLTLRGAHYKEALARYLEIAGRLNEFAGIDDYIAQARGLSGGALPPELSYVYAKWLFGRSDLALEDRIPRSQAIFEGLARDPAAPFRVQAAYFIGVGHVKLKAWDKAIAAFQSIAAMPDTGSARDREVKELADLSLGRVYFEVGRYDEAIDSYAKVPQQSDSFPDALYEIAWAYVRKGELERARNATEVLLLVAEDSVLAPEAKILQGTLLQKLQKYDEAIDTYNEVVNTYGPVEGEVEALLTASRDPVQYFDEQLARSDDSLDVTKLLPPVALKWASTRQDVADAVSITTALDESRSGLAESRAIADRILRSLDERGLESFPVLQEGYTRADAVDNMLSRAEENLTRIEGYLSAAALTPEQQADIDQLKGRAAQLRARLDTVPTTPEQIQARRARIQQAIDALDAQAFRLEVDAQSQSAQLVAIRKYVDDTRTQRKNSPDDEKAFLEKVELEQRGIEATQQQLHELRAQLLAERNNADKAVAGEGALRAQYEQLLEQVQARYAQSRGGLPAGAQQVLLRADVVRTDAQAVRSRVAQSKGIIRERVEKKAQRLREQVLLEQKLIESYAKETDAVTNDTRNLVGRIAFESFKRVHQSFYDLVLKANVGLVDVAFQRKQDKTTSIQKLAAQKDRELRQLDEEFREVLKDDD